MKESAQSKMRDEVGKIVGNSESKVGIVELYNSGFSRQGNGKFALTTDASRIHVQSSFTEIVTNMERAGLKVEAPLQEAIQKEMIRTQRVAQVQTALRVGGRILLVAGAAMDAAKIYYAEDKVRATTEVAGGWTGALTAGGATATYLALSNAAGPVAWAGYGIAVLTAGSVGYWGGSSAAGVAYDIVIKDK